MRNVSHGKSPRSTSMAKAGKSTRTTSHFWFAKWRIGEIDKLMEELKAQNGGSFGAAPIPQLPAPNPPLGIELSSDSPNAEETAATQNNAQRGGGSAGRRAITKQPRAWPRLLLAWRRRAIGANPRTWRPSARPWTTTKSPDRKPGVTYPGTTKKTLS